MLLNNDMVHQGKINTLLSHIFDIPYMFTIIIELLPPFASLPLEDIATLSRHVISPDFRKWNHGASVH